MRIGLSFSRCVRDIVDGRVDIHDVLVIIARTDFDPHNNNQWAGIWLGYGGGSPDMSGFNRFSRSAPEWAGRMDEAQFRNVSIDLWDSGRLHQPRKFGTYPKRRPEIWLEAVLPSSELQRNPAAQEAWNQFQVVAGLTNVSLDNQYR